MRRAKVMMKASPPSSKRIHSRNGRQQRNADLRGKNNKLVREMVGGEPYEYYRPGRYIVSAPGICGGRPTFKYTRIDVRHALALLTAGRTVEEIAKGYEGPVKAIHEALSRRFFSMSNSRLLSP
jgi:uncharacterized protein (DUF433 family)